MAAGLLHFYPNVKKVAFITGADDGVMPVMGPALQKAGITTGDFTYPRGTTDISTVATKVVAFKPDAIIVGNSPDEETSDVKQLDSAGLSKSVVCVCYSTVLDPKVGHPQIFPSAYLPVDAGVQSTPETDAFKAALKTHLGKDPSVFDVSIALAYYFVTRLAAEGMVKAGTTTDVAKIAQAMTQVSITEYGAKFQFDGDRYITVPLAMTQTLPDGTKNVAQVAPSS